MAYPGSYGTHPYGQSNQQNQQYPPPQYPPPPQQYGGYPPPPSYGNYPPPVQQSQYPPPQPQYGNYPPPPQHGSPSYGNYPPPGSGPYSTPQSSAHINPPAYTGMNNKEMEPIILNLLIRRITRLQYLMVNLRVVQVIL
ncbi:hypothetical protein RMCBS344292_11472 [Rhizopus microsporus]|nr:hypothetical protein RMCBS344292_11472 [Rhizopus microsporus]